MNYSSKCPHCHNWHDLDLEFSGSSGVCVSCGARLQLAVSEDGDAWLFVERLPPAPPITGRERTRRRWARQGRR